MLIKDFFQIKGDTTSINSIETVEVHNIQSFLKPIFNLYL